MHKNDKKIEKPSGQKRAHLSSRYLHCRKFWTIVTSISLIYGRERLH